MKQEISALMDGELFEDEADSLLGQIKQDSGAHQDWELYHLIGDVLRQPEHIHCGLSAKVRERMQDEPTILAPRSRGANQKIRTFALSAAASVLAVGVVVWMSQQITLEAAPQQVAMQSASMQIKPESNDYVMAHQEFSSGTEMNGEAFYIRAVSYRADEK